MVARHSTAPFPANTKGKKNPENTPKGNLAPRSISIAAPVDGIDVAQLSKTVVHCKAASKVLPLHWLSVLAERVSKAWSALITLIRRCLRYVRYTHLFRHIVCDGRGGDCNCDFHKFGRRCNFLKDQISRAVVVLRTRLNRPKLFLGVPPEVVARKLTLNYLLAS